MQTYLDVITSKFIIMFDMPFSVQHVFNRITLNEGSIYNTLFLKW